MDNTTTFYDVVVIGGGLAGLALGIQAARGGYKTILFEKDDYPRHKVCGEYISLESKPFLESLGIPIGKMNLPIIDQFLATDVYGNQYPFLLPLGGFGISRFQLDDLMYKAALQAGVRVCTNEKVTNVHFTGKHFTIDTNIGYYKARLAAASYGKRSNLDIKWKRPFAQKKAGKLENFIGVKYHVRFPFPDNTIALHNFNDGYCGISQIEDGKCCLCYLTTAANLKKCNNSISEMEKNILFENSSLKNIFETSEFLYDEPLIISQVSFSKKDLVENHVLMLGDAAGMIPPLCGNGMSMALHSSKLAYEAIETFLQNKSTREEMEYKYETAWKKRFSTRLFIGRIVQRLFGRNQMTRFFLQTMRQLPPLAKMVIQSTHGETF